MFCTLDLSCVIFRKCIIFSLPWQLALLCGFFEIALSSSAYSWATSGDIECFGAFCVCERLRSCCAFSAVLSGFGHSLPCEACRENVSHGVIVTNPLPHTQPPVFLLHFFLSCHHDLVNIPVSHLLSHTGFSHALTALMAFWHVF